MRPVLGSIWRFQPTSSRTRRIVLFWALGIGLWSVGRAPDLSAAEPGKIPPSAQSDTAALKFFEDKVRPVLANRCFECHGPEKKKGGLRLDSRATILKGGDRGPAVQPGRPEESLLVGAIQHREALQMPPKNKLPPQEIAALTAWVRMGAPWPSAPVADQPHVTLQGPRFTAEQRSFWAFRSPVASPVPTVKKVGWARSPIDRFILAALEAKGLELAPPADKRTLVRRATFDLTGLPPTPAEIDAFLADASPEAFARVVDRLLTSPHYGERWGRHWLDVARYADSNGMDENLAMANAWRYRDYVIASFNKDKPYDEFVREQLAGDLLPSADPATARERLIATGFLSLGPKMLAEDDPVKMEMDIVDEQIDTVGRTFLGLTLGCARCHDHKFDPIPTADYYALAGIFKSTQTMDHFKVVARWHERPVATREEEERHKAHEAKIPAKKSEVDKQAKAVHEKLLAQFRDPLRAGTSVHPGQAVLPRLIDALLAQHDRNAAPLRTAAAELKRLREDLAALEKARPPYPETMAVAEGKPGNLRIHIRGNHLTLGPEVPRRFPQILAGDQQTPIDAKQSGRLPLAQWLTRPDHPLTSRVMVNRVWLGHFGAGLVRTPDNFGKLGERPVNQPLLDWLAVHFVQKGWSLKTLHRTIMLSSTYQMSTAFNERAYQVDPENHLHWRMDRRRLEAEEVRDTVLAVSGRLDPTLGGSLLQGADRAYVIGYPNNNYDKYDFDRRSVYLPVIRSDVYNVFQAFDFADPSVPNGERATTTVAPQALFLMNGKLIQEQTRHLATGLLAQPNLDDTGRVKTVYERAFGRPPAPAEAARALDFVRRGEQALATEKGDAQERRLRAWQSLFRVVLAANEFIYLE
jgi:hypothetical protein